MSKLRSGALLCLCVAALCVRALAIDHLNTLQIGTDNWGNQVMQAGVVQPQYDPANVATSLKRYATDYPCVELYLQMSPPKSPTDPAFLNYGVGSVTTTPPGLLKVQPVVQGEVLRPTDLPELILLEFQCIGNVGGDALVEFNIRFNVSAPGGMVPVTAPIAFNKTCSNNAFNPYLNVGSTPNKADIITLGVYTNKLRYTAMTPYDLFYAWLDPSAPHNQTLEVGAQGHVFGNQVFLTPNYTLVNGDMLDPAIKADDSLALQINYNCQPVGAPGVTQLSFLTLSLITGNIGEPPFDPVSFVWMHVCPAPPNPTPTPTPHDPSSGLGAGATAAIVIVVLAFAAYAAACGYNYMVRKRRGIEILPGASFCARQSTSTSSYNAVVPASQTNERTPFAAGSSSEL